jgi:hypothetical protein
VAEWDTSGKLNKVRLYYPTFPLLGMSKARPPVLPANASAVSEGAVRSYQLALHAGDADAVAEQFEADGYFREPSGAYHAGAQFGILKNFQTFFSLGHGGGIALEHCTVSTTALSGAA